MSISGIFKYLTELRDIAQSVFSQTEQVRPIKIFMDNNMGKRHVKDIEKCYGARAEVTMLKQCLDGGTPDPVLYEFACESGYDLIFTCDAKMMFDNDLCTVVNRAYINNEAHKIPVVAFDSGYNFRSTLKDYEEEIFGLAYGKSMAVLDTRDIPEDRNITGINEPVITEFVPFFEQYKRERATPQQETTNSHVSASLKDPAKGKWLRDYVASRKAESASGSPKTPKND